MMAFASPALWFACGWLLGSFVTRKAMAARQAIERETKAKRTSVGDVLAARYAPNPEATQQNIPRDREFSLGIRETIPFEPLHPGPFEIENEDEPPGKWVDAESPK